MTSTFELKPMRGFAILILIVEGLRTVVNEVHPLKTDTPNLTPPKIVTCVRAEQLLKA